MTSRNPNDPATSDASSAGLGPMHRDPTVVERHRLPISALPLPSRQVSLDGRWRFRHHVGLAPTLRTEDWAADDEGFVDQEVPGSWVIQGHGIPIYTNVDYPFDTGHYPDIPLPDETGDYQTMLDVPAEWGDQRLVLRVGAAESAVEAWVNGSFVGYSTDSRLPAEFDVTGVLAAGERGVVTLRVHRWSASTWLEDQDMWWMAGLHRSVVLYATETAYLLDAGFVTRSLAADEASAEVAVDVTLGGDHDGCTVRLALHDPTGMALPVPDVAGAAERSTVTFTVRQPQLWTAEMPHLHQLAIELHSPSGRPLDRRELAVGIRTVTVAGGALLVNNRPVTLRGVNRHEHDGETGRVQSDALLAADMALLEAANVNAIRTAHYPNDERFYDLCDRHGFYVIDEANVETHGLVADPARLPADDPRFEAAFVARGRRMVERDRNHPCIVAWSLGNESGFGVGHRRMAEAIRVVDPDRPLHYHPAETDELVDIVGPMYPTLGQLESLASPADRRPVIMCEYSHAMGNSNGGLADCWRLIDAEPRLGGGFIWDWVDQGLARTTDDGERWWAYGGDFGDKPNDANFNCNGLVDADRRAHPALLHVAWVHRPVAVTLVRPPLGPGDGVRVAIHNRRDHVDLRDLSLTYELVVDGDVVAAHTLDAPVEVGPRASVEADLPLQAEAPKGGERRLRFGWRALGADGPTGVDWPGVGELHRHLVAWDELALPGVDLASSSPRIHQTRAAATGVDGGPEPTVEVGDDIAVLAAGGSRVVLDASGQPVELVLRGRSLLAGMARLGIWRAPTDNDQATFGDSQVATRLRRAGLDDEALEPLGPLESRARPGVSDDGRSASVRVLVGVPGALRIRCRWLIDATGDLAVDLRLSGELELPPLLRLGFELDLDPANDRLSWLGPGPGESYRDRAGGLFVARHRARVGDDFFPYARPQESGNHTDVAWLAVADASGSGLVALGDPRFDAAALPVDVASLRAAAHPHEIKPPGYTVLRLDAAHSGIGTGSCGPGVADRHELHARAQASNRIVLRGLAAADDPATVARRPSGLRRHQRWQY